MVLNHIVKDYEKYSLIFVYIHSYFSSILNFNVTVTQPILLSYEDTWSGFRVRLKHVHAPLPWLEMQTRLPSVCLFCWLLSRTLLSLNGDYHAFTGK